MKGFAALLPLAMLSGCSWLQSEPAAPETWTHWICNSRAELDWRFATPSKETVDVRLGGGQQVYHLAAEPGASGALYSDGVLAFHTKGDEGLVYWVATNDLIGRGCKAP